jgi:multidrug transporter EmrE-like cation transporter
MDFLIAIGAALSFVLGGVFMQMSQGLSQLIPTVSIYLCFGLGATLQTLAIQKSGEMGITYVLIVGLEAVLAVGCGIFFFQEGYSLLKLVGITLVTVGIVFLRSGNS